MTALRSEHYTVKEFYPYASYVQMVLIKYDEFDKKDNNLSSLYVKKMFDDFLKIAEKKSNKNLKDNKIAMKIKHNETGTEFYIGYKDGVYSLGLDIYNNSEAIKIN